MDDLNDEDFTKEMMKFKKLELIALMNQIRKKTKKLRECFEAIVEVKTYREHKGTYQKGYDHLYFDFKKAIATYLGEKIQ